MKIGLRNSNPSAKPVPFPNAFAIPIMTITALFGNGGGGFISKVVTTANDLFVISAADLNSDGASDIVGVSFNTMFVSYGHPDRTFNSKGLTPADVRGINPMLADFNGDRRKDIVYPALNGLGDNNIGTSTLQQTSAGSFRQLGFEAIDTYNPSPGDVPFFQTLVGDYNRDGKPDVMLISSDEVELRTGGWR